jgi:hypothetical protein
MRLPRQLRHLLVRHKVKVHETSTERFAVRVARTREEYEDAFGLVKAAYVYLGIDALGSCELRLTEQHLLPEATVLVCYERDEIVGTMTVTLDSPAALPLDATYPEELATLRRRGARMVEYGSLAVVGRCQHLGVTHLLNIAAYRLARDYLRATHTVVGVHPRAEDYYGALYDFRAFAAVRQHSSLDAPVIGLVQNMDDFPSFAARKLRRALGTGHSTAEHLFAVPLDCLKLPPAGMSSLDFVRWKLPRQVFAEVFGDELPVTLSGELRDYLEEVRSRDTLAFLAPTLLVRTAQT